MHSRIGGDLNLKTNPPVPKNMLIQFSLSISSTNSKLYMEERSSFDEMILCKTLPKTS